MKTLIDKSIKIEGIGHPNAKTVFDLNVIPVLSEEATLPERIEVDNKKLENDLITKSNSFVSLVKISGRTLGIGFKYTEGKTIKDGKILVTIPKTSIEEEIKDFIISEINNTLK